jgi:hypothetical protein
MTGEYFLKDKYFDYTFSLSTKVSLIFSTDRKLLRLSAQLLNLEHKIYWENISVDVQDFFITKTNVRMPNLGDVGNPR